MTATCVKVSNVRSSQKKTPKQAIRKAVRKEALKTGFAHFCVADATCMLGVSLEWLWVRLQS